MSQARRTRHFARSAKRVRGERRGEGIIFPLFSFRASGKMPLSPRLAHKASVVQVTSMQARAIPAVAGVNTALLSMNEEKKSTLFECQCI